MTTRPFTFVTAAFALATTLALSGDAEAQATRRSSGDKKPQPSLRSVAPIETGLLEKESASFKSTRSIFSFLEPPPPPPPKPPPPPPDKDDDGVPDFRDNCPAIKNPDQQDIDRDGIGTACETELPEIAPPPPPPPKPQPPAFRYTVLGTFGSAAKPIAVFSRDGEILNVALGERFGPKNEFVLKRIGIESVEIGYKDFPADVKRVKIGG